jgi:hypothetical protein
MSKDVGFSCIDRGARSARHPLKVGRSCMGPSGKSYWAGSTPAALNEINAL